MRILYFAAHDALTRFAHRRLITPLIATAQQHSAPSPLLLMLDIDHFKRINDTHGHAVGDQVLCAFTSAVQGSLRSGDVLARWGGEEFVLMLRTSDIAHAAQLLERVRAAVAALTIPTPSEPIRLTVSIGWAAQTNGETPAESIENTLEQADQALYYAKAQGRNQVVSYAYAAQACHTPLADDSAPHQHSLATPKAAAC